ncbi:hypothetical protein WAL18_18090 [Waltera acetigignens]
MTSGYTISYEKQQGTLFGNLEKCIFFAGKSAVRIGAGRTKEGSVT